MKVFSLSLFVIFIGSACEAMETSATIIDKQVQPARSIEHPGYIARECSPSSNRLVCHNIYVWPEVDRYPARHIFILRNCLGETFPVYVEEEEYRVFRRGDRYQYYAYFIPFL